jgi:uncharacterized protein YecT (DUF1311 family)
MKKLLLLLTLTITLLFSASFDCKKAKTEVEKLICSDEKLSKLDEELNEVYKKALARSNNKEILKKQQITWLNNTKKHCKEIFCIKLEYESRIFYLQPDGFNIIYSEDNKTCNWFANLLNNDLKQYKEINLSRHKEFNWVEWKSIQERSWEVVTIKDGIIVNYFDINNDGNKEGVFISEYDHRNYDLLDLHYTTKEDGKIIEEYISTKDRSKEAEIWNRRLGGKGNNEGYNVYHFTKSASHFLYNNNQTNYAYIREKGLGGFSSPEPYPLKFDNNYFLAVFGTIEHFRPYMIKLYTMPNNGNIVALAKYNPDNIKSDVCILVRANPNTEKYLRYK